MNKQRKASLLVGLGLLVLGLVFYISLDKGDGIGQFLQRVLISLAGAGIASIFFGFLEIKFSWLRAGGPLAVFVLLYFVNPPDLNSCQKMTITGSVIDVNGVAVPHATVMIEATNLSDETTSTGKFEIKDIPIELTDKQVVIKCFHDAYKTADEEIRLDGCTNEINFKSLALRN